MYGSKFCGIIIDTVEMVVSINVINLVNIGDKWIYNYKERAKLDRYR